MPALSVVSMGNRLPVRLSSSHHSVRWRADLVEGVGPKGGKEFAGALVLAGEFDAIAHVLPGQGHEPAGKGVQAPCK